MNEYTADLVAKRPDRFGNFATLSEPFERRSVVDGSTTAIIIIPIVPTISLALWIFMVYWADAHPRNDADAHPRTGGRRETRTAHPEVTSGTPAHDIPSPRPSPDNAPGRGQPRHTGPMALPGPPGAGGHRPLKDDAEPRERRHDKLAALRPG